MSYDPKRTTWMNPNIEYLFDAEIIEYDMKDAGFSIIKQFGLLPPEKIRELERLDKGLERHVAIGKIQGADKDFSQSLSSKFAEVRSIFVQYNHLTDNDIISVKKDALFTIGRCKRTKFGNVHFMEKNHYTSYIRFPNIQNLEIYYSSDGIDVKGMSDSSVNRHRIYILQFIREVISKIENKDVRARRFIMKFISDYKAGALEEMYYLEFNNKSSEINSLFNYQNILVPLVQIIAREIT